MVFKILSQYEYSFSILPSRTAYLQQANKRRDIVARGMGRAHHFQAQRGCTFCRHGETKLGVGTGRFFATRVPANPGKITTAQRGVEAADGESKRQRRRSAWDEVSRGKGSRGDMRGMKKRQRHVRWRCLLLDPGGYLSSRAVSSQVLSAYEGLTAVFGMGTGGTPQLNHRKLPVP